MKTEISVKNLQKRIPLKPKIIVRAAKKILKAEKVSQATLSLVFVTNAKIKSLNKKYLKRDHTTDVLAFDLNSNAFTVQKTRHSKSAKKRISGEIIISTDAAFENSRIFKTSLHKEVLLYVIHGILHLSGYDDHAKNDIEKIRKREKQLLELICK